MFDLINGIPVHPLVVHAIVVLLPLTVIGTLAIAVVPRWRVTYGHLVVIAAAVSTALIPIATASGEELEKRVGGDPEHHAEMGEMLIWFAIPLLILVSALWWLARRATRAEGTSGAGASRRLVSIVAGLAVIAALATSFQVYRVGDSGAKATWEDATSSSGN